MYVTMYIAIVCRRISCRMDVNVPLQCRWNNICDCVSEQRASDLSGRCRSCYAINRHSHAFTCNSHVMQNCIWLCLLHLHSYTQLLVAIEFHSNVYMCDYLCILCSPRYMILQMFVYSTCIHSTPVKS